MANARAYHVVLVAPEDNRITDLEALQALIEMATMRGWKVLVQSEGEWWSYAGQ